MVILALTIFEVPKRSVKTDTFSSKDWANRRVFSGHSRDDRLFEQKLSANLLPRILRRLHCAKEFSTSACFNPHCTTSSNKFRSQRSCETKATLRRQKPSATSAFASVNLRNCGAKPTKRRLSHLERRKRSSSARRELR